jgi:hypothetical protein
MEGRNHMSATDGHEIVTAVSGDDDGATRKLALVSCPVGKKVVGGGGKAYRKGIGAGIDFARGVAIVASAPFTATQWLVAAEGTSDTADDWWVEAYAICTDGN